MNTQTIKVIEVYCSVGDGQRIMGYFSTQKLADTWIAEIKRLTNADGGIHSRPHEIYIDNPNTDGWALSIRHWMMEAPSSPTSPPV